MTLNKTAIGFIPQLTPMTIMTSCFQNTTFCSGGRDIEVQHDDTLWNNVCGRTIPYMLDPLCISFMLSNFPSHWGYSGPGMRGELQNLIVRSGVVNDNFIAPALGDTTYKETIKSDASFRYVPFGNMLLNYIQQHTRVAEIQVSYRQWKKASGISYDVLPVWLEGDEFQPDYDPNLFRFHVGDMPTYDWFTRSMLVPYFNRRLMQNDDWIRICLSSSGESLQAGFELNTTAPSRTIELDGIALASLFMGADIPDIPESQTEPATSQKN